MNQIKQTTNQKDSLKLIIAKVRSINDFSIDPNKEITDYYHFIEKIGEGAFGKVYKAIDKASGKERAIKYLYKKDITNRKQLLNETENLKKLDHPNITRLFETYQTKSKFFLV